MAIVAGIILIVFWRGRSAVWGGATVGAIVGLILSLIKHNWILLALSFAIGTFVGLFAEGLGILSDILRHRRTVGVERRLIEAEIETKAEQRRRSNVFGTWSLVLSIIGFFWWPSVLGIIALILAILQFRRHVNKRSIAGLTLGIIDISLAFFWYHIGLMPSIF